MVVCCCSNCVWSFFLSLFCYAVLTSSVLSGFAIREERARFALLNVFLLLCGCLCSV